MQGKMVVVLMFFVVVLSPFVVADWNIERNLGTRTPYWNQGVDQPHDSECQLVHLNFVTRHGIRYPTNSNIRELEELVDDLRKYNDYVSDSFPYIKNWTNPYSMDAQGFLSLTGQEELFFMAQRYNATYSPLFSEQYYPNVYVMQSTQIPRAGVSASAFAQGYLQGSGEIGPFHFQPPYIFSNSIDEDYLRFFDNCDAYQAMLSNGTINKTESEAYRAMTYPAIAARIATALGVAPFWNISNSKLDTMFDACAFEIAVLNITDGWCPLFTRSDIEAYVYAMDLETYWKKSYGSGLGYQIGSVVLQSMVSVIDGIISNSSSTSGQKAYLRFAHAETVIPLNAVLGFYKDDYVLTANLSAAQIRDRAWTTTVVAPFAANIALALYSCGSDYSVVLTLNEVETLIPGCAGQLYCPYATFKEIYADALAFNYTAACAVPETLIASPKREVAVSEFAVGLIVAFAVGGGVAFVFTMIYFKRKTQKYSYLEEDSPMD